MRKADNVPISICALTCWNPVGLFRPVMGQLLDNEEFNCVLLTQYCAGDKIEKNEIGGARSAYGEARGVNRVLVWKAGRKSPLERPRGRWEDNIKMDLQVVGCGVRNGFIWLRIGTGGGHM